MEESILLYVRIGNLLIKLCLGIVRNPNDDMLLGNISLIALYAESSDSNIKSSRGTDIRQPIL